MSHLFYQFIDTTIDNRCSPGISFRYPQAVFTILKRRYLRKLNLLSSGIHIFDLVIAFGLHPVQIVVSR